MSLDRFKELYSNYCFRQGYKEKDIEVEESKKILDTFGIFIEEDETVKEPAFLNIRFKTEQEKKNESVKV